MKYKRSKKLYAWKDKWKRKKRLSCCFSWNAPKCYRDDYDYEASFRMRVKTAMNKMVKKHDKELINFPGPHRHSAGWDYW